MCSKHIQLGYLPKRRANSFKQLSLHRTGSMCLRAQTVPNPTVATHVLEFRTAILRVRQRRQKPSLRVLVRVRQVSNEIGRSTVCTSFRCHMDTEYYV